MITQYIPDLVGEVVMAADTSLQKANNINVYYEFGNLFDIKKMLTEKDGDPSQPVKYPLVWLVTPFEESHDVSHIYATADLRFIIANDTDVNYRMEERRDNVFVPILYPVFAELEKQIGKSKNFITNGVIPYKKTDMQLARVDREGVNLLNDAADVIDVTFLKVQIRNKIC